MADNKVLELMTELGALHSGHFLLSSGLHSDKYFQCAKILQFPELARELGTQMGEFFAKTPHDLVVSPAMGGILIGHEVARALGRRFVFSERQDGVMMIRRGFEIAQGEKVIIVEDVVTRGTSLLEVIKCVEDAGGVVTGLTSIIDRTSGEVQLPLPLHALAKVTVQTFSADSCPMCADGQDVVKPGSRGN
ncbi:MAG: orotate phosphoribosyltransferase [Candidatus Krumholzibacteriia bacterium]|jgi:orotate phosphoribosyltransferase